MEHARKGGAHLINCSQTHEPVNLLCKKRDLYIAPAFENKPQQQPINEVCNI